MHYQPLTLIIIALPLHLALVTACSSESMLGESKAADATKTATTTTAKAANNSASAKAATPTATTTTPTATAAAITVDNKVQTTAANVTVNNQAVNNQTVNNPTVNNQAVNTTPAATTSNVTVANKTDTSAPAQTVTVANQPVALGPLNITKTITGLGGLEDKTVTISVANIAANGTLGAAQTITFNAGAQGQQQIPNVCGNSPVTIAVGVQSNNGIFGSSSMSTGQGSTSSTITFDPATCILTRVLAGNSGDTINFTCANGQPVTVTSSH